MSTLITAARSAFITLIQRSSGISLLLLLLLSGVQAQSSPTDGTTPLALSPGAPAGSYALSSFDNVNLYNGHLNFSLPLLTVSGRGGAQMTLPLPIERTWRIEDVQIPGPGGGVNTIHIAQPNWWMGLEPYGLGKLAARHVGEGETTCGGRNLYVITLMQWLVQDHLGSTRMLVDRSGSLGGIKRHDFLPFGEELSAGIGIRSSALGYSADSVRQKFGSKERDETGLDFFQARYFSSVQGRFVSPGDFAGGPTELFAEVAAHNPTFYADIAEPQSLNRYSYCLNNPLKFVDPDGHKATMADAIRQVVVAPAPPQIKALVIGGIIVGAVYEGIKKADYGCGDFAECGYIQDLKAQSANQNILNKATNDASSSGNQGASSQSGSNAQQNGGDEEPPFGHRGTQTTGTTVWKATGSKERIDVENPNPGQRPGQIHYQDKDNKKYLYNPVRKEFIGASKSLNKELLRRPEIQKAIQKGLKLLGEEAL
jgi:RHS repeat-associated protein